MMLADLTLDEMYDYATQTGLPKFRGKQIFDAIYSGLDNGEISTLPQSIRDKIAADYPKYNIAEHYVSKDGTVKFLFSLGDGQVVECVLMDYKYGKTLCLSTQVGCRMGCKFCASGLNGLIRNLTAGEMLGEVVKINRYAGGNAKNRAITNLVLMGSGEPLDNFDNVVKFLRLVSSPDGINISQRNISLSTCGIVPNIYKLADAGMAVNLTISLHAPNDEIRRQTMPIANAFTIDEIISACKYYFEKTGRRIYFEYTLIRGVNDGEECVRQLSTLLKGLVCHVNVIPLNEVKERSLKTVTRSAAYKFASSLESSGISATVRRTLGEDISGACGQLRNRYLKEGDK